jgi:hypothetical protein
MPVDSPPGRGVNQIHEKAWSSAGWQASISTARRDIGFCLFSTDKLCDQVGKIYYEQCNIAD